MTLIHCPHCQGQLAFAAEHAHQQMSCPFCGQVFQMPAAASAPPLARVEPSRVRAARGGRRRGVDWFQGVTLVLLLVVVVGGGLFLLSLDGRPIGVTGLGPRDRVLFYSGLTQDGRDLPVIAGATSKDLAKARDLFDDANLLGLVQMNLLGRAYPIQNGTPGTVISGGLVTAKVQVHKGEHAGRTVFVYATQLRKVATESGAD